MSTNTIITSLNTNVGPRFMHVDNESLMNTCRDLAIALDPTSTVRITGNERRAAGLITLHSFAFGVPGDSTLTPRIMLTNDNTGRKSLRLNIGLFRLICSNGLMLGVPGLHFERRIKHVWSENSRAKVLNIPLVAEEILAYLASGDIESIIDHAMTTPVADPIGVIGSLPSELVGSRAKETAISTVVFGGRHEDDPSNAWGLYNIVNEATRFRSRKELTALTKDEGLLSHILTLVA